MNPRAALLLSIVSGILAVGLVSLDLAYSLTARLEYQDAATGQWHVLSSAPSGDANKYATPLADCGKGQFRVFIDNHKPLSDSVRVEVRAFNGSRGSDQQIMLATPSLAAFEVRDFPFTIPDAMYDGQGGSPGGPIKVGQANSTQITATVDDLYLSACATREA